ncbi:Fatty acyl-CoA reductase 1 [Melipona quadrifasciata]|uniref:Fatty acyl-CoA reductase n=1 Tax=Melipona quadrifasciata TaxID=166423 RepID=A0A0M8ZPD5_9HYME|nr:Fatty acyl-CoA reductase 1 [Melipona quadrifasciata]
MGEVQEARRLTEEESNCKSQIRKFYAGKHILLTGCTGYLGTIILEKLLRTCTEISKVYILVREKANMAIEDRMKKLFENEVSLKRKYQMRQQNTIMILTDSKFYYCFINPFNTIEEISHPPFLYDLVTCKIKFTRY